MPIYLRKFYMQRLIKHYEDEKKEIEKAKGKKF
jgi:hypothetical protein